MDKFLRFPLILIGLAFLLPSVLSDTPANCTFEDIRGVWTIHETSRRNNGYTCDESSFKPDDKWRIYLDYPNIVTDEIGNRGTWTLIYNQGFEFTILGRSYFAFSAFNKTDLKTSYCDRTELGYSRDVTMRHWSCFKAMKIEKVEPKVAVTQKSSVNLDALYEHDHEYIRYINEVQSSWVAKIYPEYELLTQRQMLMKKGGPKSKVHSRPTTAKPSMLSRMRSVALPKSFDWRNVSGVNYVSPIRNQGSCGSCYIFASMAGIESRLQILTNRIYRPILSPQDVIECSHVSQGCDGGFPYLIAGRYAQELGAVEEHLNPYKPEEVKKCVRGSMLQHFVSNYRYVGGYFGACNEEEMMLALVKGGPLMVGFEVYEDFMSYKGGIYHHVEKKTLQKFNPLELTNHAVLVVGYGIENNEKYWIVKNSWGEEWGEGGFFRIRRGNDECGIESMAVEAIPIPP